MMHLSSAQSYCLHASEFYRHIYCRDEDLTKPFCYDCSRKGEGFSFKFDTHIEEPSESYTYTVSCVVIGIILFLVVLCISLMTYELCKYRKQRNMQLRNQRNQEERQNDSQNQQVQNFSRRTVQDGPLPYLQDQRPPSYEELFLSEKGLPSYEEAINASGA